VDGMTASKAMLFDAAPDKVNVSTSNPSGL
jgi:hypothetical protein